MALPPAAQPTQDWMTLSPDEKRARTLEVADELFAREGLDVAMPVLAGTIGIGVGSLYRQFPTKDDLIAELILERITATRKLWEEAADRPDAWIALRETVVATVELSLDDYLTRDMLTMKMSDERLANASKPILGHVEALLARARQDGSVRADADVADIRVIFRSIHDANSIAPGGATRLACLVLDGLETR